MSVTGTKGNDDCEYSDSQKEFLEKYILNTEPQHLGEGLYLLWVMKFKGTKNITDLNQWMDKVNAMQCIGIEYGHPDLPAELPTDQKVSRINRVQTENTIGIIKHAMFHKHPEHGLALALIVKSCGNLPFKISKGNFHLGYRGYCNWVNGKKEFLDTITFDLLPFPEVVDIAYEQFHKSSIEDKFKYLFDSIGDLKNKENNKGIA